MKIPTGKLIREIIIVGIVAFVITIYQQAADFIEVIETSQDPIKDATDWTNSFGLAALLSAARAAIAAVTAKVLQVLPLK